MHISAATSRALSRRRFLSGAASATLAACSHLPPAGIRYRLGLSQTLDSPNYIRLQEMADSIRVETGGQMQIDLYGAGALGSDNAMLGMLQRNEMEMYMAGNVFGPLVPVTEMPGLPFTFKDSAAVFAALDGAMGD